jgi:hypothetical protein
LALVGLFVLIALNVLLWNARRHDSTKDKSENLNKKERMKRSDYDGACIKTVASRDV